MYNYTYKRICLMDKSVYHHFVTDKLQMNTLKFDHLSLGLALAFNINNIMNTCTLK